MRLTACDTKTLYDTEFEATIAAAHKFSQYGEEMVVYACNPSNLRLPHYHLTHKLREQSRGAGKRYSKCPDCGLIMRRKKFEQGKHTCTRTVQAVL